jgi:hypothetical protein
VLLSGAVNGLLTRRRFNSSLAWLAASTALTRRSAAEPSSSHLDVGLIEHDRVLAAATTALSAPIRTLSGIPSPHAAAQVFYSEIAPEPDPRAPDKSHRAFREHAATLRNASFTIAALMAAFVLTHEDRYALCAGRHLYAWFVDPATRTVPDFSKAGFDDTSSAATPAGVVDLVPLAEIARALSFLPDTAALSPPDLATTQGWFASLIAWLNEDRNAFIAREAKDHTASAWLLLATAISRSLGDDATLEGCRHRFRRPTIRNQINALGEFPHEITTAFPYRNTLLNFDLLATAAQLLSTPFDNLWSFELEDGPGMRSVAAYLYPAIHDRSKWPQIADPEYFRDLPGRRPALLFAGRAFDRPEYIDLYRSLADPTNTPEPIAASFPISQPLLFTARAPHGR